MVESCIRKNEKMQKIEAACKRMAKYALTKSAFVL